MAKLNTFLTGTPGWTADLAPGGSNRAIWSKAGVSAKIFVSWDTNNLGLGIIQDIASPVDQVGTAQVGYEFTSNTITTNRYVNIMTGPYQAYHFFEDDNYIHIVVEISTGLFRHFGWGQLIKLGSWTGGMYSYGHFWNQAASVIDDPTALQHLVHFGGSNTTDARGAAGMHASGLPGQSVGSKYLRNTTSTITTDVDSDPIDNMFPSGWQDGQNVHFMACQQSQLNGFAPLIPIPVYQWDFSATPDNGRLLGYLPDARDINLLGLNPAQEVVVGSDTWVVFPVTRKGNQGLSFDQEQSYNFGLAYKKVTT